MVELLIATGVLLIASMAAFSSQLASLNLMKTSSETDTAMSDLQTAMEQVLTQPVATSWDDLDFQHDTALPNFDDRNLANEQIVVTYPGFVAGGDVPNPLSVQLTASWNDFQGRERSLQLSSMVAQ